ncbi:hypothetical protein C8R46DRAFT_1108679 [Mycena filopes]|nr:hypothetical protein C8R46DRAFT_1108679 [Mycena filopes]
MPRLPLSASVSGLVLLNTCILLATAQVRCSSLSRSPSLFKQPSQPLRLILTKRDSAISHSAALAIGFTLLGIGLLIFVSLACCGCCLSTSTRTSTTVPGPATDEGEGGAPTEIDGEPATSNVDEGNNAKSDSLAGEVALLRARVQQLEEEERARERGTSAVASTSGAEAAPPTDSEPPPTYVRAVKEVV